MAYVDDVRGPYSAWRRRAARRNLVCGGNQKLVICEVLRFCYDLLHQYPDAELREALTEHLVTAFLMAKSMDTRLRYYKEKTADLSGGAGYKIGRIPGSQARLKMRQRRAQDG